MGNQAPVDNPCIARFWTFTSSHEPESLRAFRGVIPAALSGRVLKLGAGGRTSCCPPMAEPRSSNQDRHFRARYRRESTTNS